MEYEDETSEEDTPKSGIVEKKVEGKNKKFIKGERLKYYAAGMPLYSSSRGMKKPEVEKLSNKEAMERVSDCKMVYRETYAIGYTTLAHLVNKLGEIFSQTDQLIFLSW